MKASLVTVCLAGLFLGFGCSSTDEMAGAGAEPGGFAAGSLQTGMTAAEARAVAGEPAVVEEQDCSTRQTVWRFADGGVAILRDGRIAFHYP